MEAVALDGAVLDGAVSDEDGRLAALADLGLLDGPSDDELDAVVRVAAAVAGVPHATINLIDGARQCQLSAVGFAGSDTARGTSMCAVRFLEGRTVHVPDASRHPDYAANPWVTGALGSVRLYVSVPLLTAGGHALGTLCVFDTLPGEVPASGLARLEDLAGVLVALFERRRQARRQGELAAEADELRALAELTTAELAARQELTDAVLDTVDVGIVAAGPDGRLTLFNRAAQDWHGTGADPRLPPGEHAGHYDLYEADGSTPLAAGRVPLHRAAVEGSVTGAEIVIAPPGRPARRVLVSGRALTAPDGSPLGAVVAQTDVTADREHRAALQAALDALGERSAELERSNAELERFAAVASHDLRSPLTVVDGYLELLADVHGHQLDDRARDWIATSRRGVRRMQSLIEALLSYATAGAQLCAREPTDVRDVLDQAVVDLRALVAAAGATITGAPDLPRVSCDPIQLRQLLQNLLANALTHRAPGRPCRVEVSATRDEGAWTVAVADHGPGIPAGDRERVFAMFATSAATSASTAPGRAGGGAGGGHGIGLATCRRIVERHGGRIGIEDTPGGGATVRFTLPDPGRDR